MLGLDPPTPTGPGASGSASSSRSAGWTRCSPCARRSSSTPATTRAPRAVDETIELVGLAEKADERAGKLSGGQQRRLDVAVGPDRRPRAALPRRADDRLRPVGPPPGVGGDRGLRDLGKTVFLTTHYMDEAQALADRVAIIAARPDRRRRDARRARRPRRGRRPRSASACPTRRRAAELPLDGASRSPSGEGRTSLRSTDPVADLNELTELGARPRARARTASRCAARASRTSTWSSPTARRRRGLSR